MKVDTNLVTKVYEVAEDEYIIVDGQYPPESNSIQDRKLFTQLPGIVLDHINISKMKRREGLLTRGQYSVKARPEPYGDETLPVIKARISWDKVERALTSLENHETDISTLEYGETRVIRSESALSS